MAWNLSNLLTFLRSFCVDASITRAELIKFIELRYDRVYNDTLDFYKVEGTFSLVSGTRYYYMSRQLDLANKPRFFNQTNDNEPIQIVEYDHLLAIDSDLSQTGTPWKAAFVELSPVQRQPNESSDNGTVTVRSSSSADTTQTVTLSGKATVSGQVVEVSEDITLTGTTAVTSSRTWHTFYGVSKSGDTTGYVTVTSSSASTIYAILDPYSDHAEYQKWRFWPTSNVTDTIRYTGFRKPWVPQSDGAVLDVSRNMLAGFVYGLRADVHDVNFDMIKSQKFEAKFEEALQRAKESNAWGDSQTFYDHVETEVLDPRRELEDVSGSILVGGAET